MSVYGVLVTFIPQNGVYLSRVVRNLHITIVTIYEKNCYC
jgi:hypothetical protein